jgi:hypothetical protein
VLTDLVEEIRQERTDNLPAITAQIRETESAYAAALLEMRRAFEVGSLTVVDVRCWQEMVVAVAAFSRFDDRPYIEAMKWSPDAAEQFVARVGEHAEQLRAAVSGLVRTANERVTPADTRRNRRQRRIAQRQLAEYLRDGADQTPRALRTFRPARKVGRPYLNVICSGVTDVGSHWLVGSARFGRETEESMKLAAQSPVIRVSLLVEIVLVFVLQTAPKPQPDIYANWLGAIFGALPLVATLFGKSLYPAAWNLSLFRTGIALASLGILPPIAGPIEAWLGGDPQIFQSDRFALHLITNLASVLAATALLGLIRSTSGFSGFTNSFADKAALNCALPMATLSAFAYVRWQQREVLTGYSLSHLHQLANFVFLTAVLFTAATTVLYLYAFAIRQAKRGEPLPYSWQIGVAVVFSVAFFYLCGLVEWSPPVRAMNLTFLTGTPAALAAVLVFVSLLKPSTDRERFAIAFASLGYILYTVEVIFASRGAGEGLSLYYFMPGVFALLLALLAGTLYRSPGTAEPLEESSP